MSPNRNRAQDLHAVRGDWETVGDYLSTAIQEVATELGNEEFASGIAALAVSDEVLPNPDALKLLEDTYPGSAERVMARMSEIQRETHQRELAEVRKPRIREYGRATLEGFASLNILGPSPRRKH
jgi:uncharacterized membrane protein